jgi:serine/threonine protein kinase
VLVDIADALVALDGRVVHRDLKPENVLELDGRWCLADFGIARYAEATTATETRKGAMSLPYAAPERFRGERAGAAADVYSVGVMGYELLSGELPFRGSSPEEFQDAHLHHDPPDLEAVPALLAALVTECLYKSPGARPTPANLRARLERAANAAPSGGLARLSDANMNEVQRLGRA